MARFASGSVTQGLLVEEPWNTNEEMTEGVWTVTLSGRSRGVGVTDI